MQSEIRIVAIKENFSLSETYLYGEYSDDVKIAYDGKQFKISVERFHKNDSSQAIDNTVNVRLIGYQQHQNIDT